MLVSPLGGLLISLFPIEITFAVDVVTAVIAILLRFFVKSGKQEAAPDGKKAGYFGDLRQDKLYQKTQLSRKVFAYMIPLSVLIAPVAVCFHC